LGITHIDLTPSLARLLHPDDVPSLTKGVFITGGEQLRQEILDAWGDYNCIYNGYGPTEATIGVTMYPRVPRNGKPSNIGPQFLNVGSYVFKLGTTEPVLRGAVGELCVSGKLLGKGYLNRPELTEERFPYVGKFGERIYRTGDLVRILHDGSFLFLGRADDQVKLRGQRLELSEINEVIKNQVKEVQGVVTLVLKHSKQQKEQLVTFFVQSATGSDSDTNALVNTVRDACRGRLPGYMVPTYFIMLEKLPLSANNKADFKELAKMFDKISISDLQNFGSTSSVAKKWTAKEQAVLEALAKILDIGVATAATASNIFELGMDSISVIGLTSNLQKAGYTNAKLSIVMKSKLLSVLLQLTWLTVCRYVNRRACASIGLRKH
jgi:acyl-coenzyme A synthetase/AMP-(fatty) acid ligase